MEKTRLSGLDPDVTTLYFTIRLFNYMVLFMTTDPLSSIFAALADPTRRAILTRLSRGEVTVQELAKPFDMTLPAVSKHLKVLERAGLIQRGREAQWRPCRLHAAPLKKAAHWLESYRQFWEERLDRLDDYLRTLQSLPAKPGAKKPRRPPHA